jgi:hypothetical protein
MSLFHHRLHESVAFSALTSCATTLHISWILNLLIHRSSYIADLFSISVVGPVSGLYALSTLSFFVIFLLILLATRGRDLSNARGRLVWFFILSVAVFVMMTLPVVYEFGITVE